MLQAMYVAATAIGIFIAALGVWAVLRDSIRDIPNPRTSLGQSLYKLWQQYKGDHDHFGAWIMAVSDLRHDGKLCAALNIRMDHGSREAMRKIEDHFVSSNAGLITMIGPNGMPDGKYFVVTVEHPSGESMQFGFTNEKKTLQLAVDRQSGKIYQRSGYGHGIGIKRASAWTEHPAI